MRVLAPMIHAFSRRTPVALVLFGAVALASCDLNPNVEACSVTVAPTNVSVAVNARANLVGTAFDCKGASIRNKKVSFSTANATVATVAVDGTSNASVIGIAVGQTTINAVTSNGKSATVQVTVTPEVATNVTVTPSAITLRKTNTRTFTAQLKNAAGNVITGRPVRWTTSNSSLATIDGNGALIALLPGTVVVTADADGATGSSAVTITEIPINTCQLTPASNKILVGQAVQPTLLIRDSTNALLTLTGRAITWTSSNEIVAGVSQSGVISARKAGTAEVRAISSENPTVFCPTAVEVVDPRVDKVLIQSRGGFIRVGVPRLLQATALDSVSNPIPGKVVTWRSLDPAFATITALGIVTGNSVGSARIVASLEGAADTVTFPVEKVPVGSVTVSPAQAQVFERENFQFTVVVKDTAGTVVTDRLVEWFSSNPTLATVTNGLARSVASGVVNITARSESVNGTSALLILPTPVDTIIAPSTFTLVRGTSVGFTIVLRDAAGNELRGRTVNIVSSQPNIAVVPPSTNNSTVQVVGVAAGVTELTLQALNGNGQAEGKATKVSVTVTAPPTP